MGHAQQAAFLERSRAQEDARLDTQKQLVWDKIQAANAKSEERVENKRFLRQLQMEKKEREMEEAILKVIDSRFIFSYLYFYRPQTKSGAR